MRLAQGLRTVAIIEAAKGLVVLLTGLGLFSLMHRNVQQLAELLVAHTHLNPASHTPHVFIEFAARLDDARLRQLAAAALAYAILRLAEAWGLWHGRAWGEMLAAASGAIYVPFELRELVQRPGLPSASLLLVNLAIVAFMLYSLQRKRACASS